MGTGRFWLPSAKILWLIGTRDVEFWKMWTDHVA
jgi:hypothetical protein